MNMMYKIAAGKTQVATEHVFNLDNPGFVLGTVVIDPHNPEHIAVLMGKLASVTPHSTRETSALLDCALSNCNSDIHRFILLTGIIQPQMTEAKKLSQFQAFGQDIVRIGQLFNYANIQHQLREDGFTPQVIEMLKHALTSQDSLQHDDIAKFFILLKSTCESLNLQVPFSVQLLFALRLELADPDQADDTNASIVFEGSPCTAQGLHKIFSELETVDSTLDSTYRRVLRTYISEMSIDELSQIHLTKMSLAEKLVTASMIEECDLDNKEMYMLAIFDGAPPSHALIADMISHINALDIPFTNALLKMINALLNQIPIQDDEEESCRGITKQLNNVKDVGQKARLELTLFNRVYKSTTGRSQCISRILTSINSQRATPLNPEQQQHISRLLSGEEALTKEWLTFINNYYFKPLDQGLVDFFLDKLTIST